MCLVCTFCVTAFAAQPETIAVQYGANAGYTAYIPEMVSLGNHIGDKVYAKVCLVDALIGSKAAITVSLTGDSYSFNQWHLKSGTKKLAYTIMTENSDGTYTNVANKTELFRLVSGNSIERHLCYVTEELPKQSGAYQDILTFIIAYHTI
jgi:hypothetical protein